MSKNDEILKLITLLKVDIEEAKGKQQIHIEKADEFDKEIESLRKRIVRLAQKLN